MGWQTCSCAPSPSVSASVFSGKWLVWKSTRTGLPRVTGFLKVWCVLGTPTRHFVLDGTSAGCATWLDYEGVVGSLFSQAGPGDVLGRVSLRRGASSPNPPLLPSLEPAPTWARGRVAGGTSLTLGALHLPALLGSGLAPVPPPWAPPLHVPPLGSAPSTSLPSGLRPLPHPSPLGWAPIPRSAPLGSAPPLSCNPHQGTAAPRSTPWEVGEAGEGGVVP